MDSSGKESSSPGAGGVKGDGGNGQGNSGSSADRKAAAPVQPGGQPGASTSQEDDGGSSPLVPILVAIFVLAGISLAALLIRHRRQRGESASSISPEAG